MAELDLYFLRVWKRAEGGGGFRAAVKPLDSERVQIFSDPVQLAAFLTARATRAAPPSPPPTVSSPAVVPPAGTGPDPGPCDRSA